MSYPIDLSGRIAQCREQRQHAPALARESEGLLALAAFIGLQSRAMPLAPPADGRLQATLPPYSWQMIRVKLG